MQIITGENSKGLTLTIFVLTYNKKWYIIIVIHRKDGRYEENNNYNPVCI